MKAKKLKQHGTRRWETRTKGPGDQDRGRNNGKNHTTGIGNIGGGREVEGGPRRRGLSISARAERVQYGCGRYEITRTTKLQAWKEPGCSASGCDNSLGDNKLRRQLRASHRISIRPVVKGRRGELESLGEWGHTRGVRSKPIDRRATAKAPQSADAIARREAQRGPRAWGGRRARLGDGGGEQRGLLVD